MKNVFSVDYDKEKKLFTVVMSNKNTLSKGRVEKAFKAAKLAVKVSAFDKAKNTKQ